MKVTYYCYADLPQGGSHAKQGVYAVTIWHKLPSGLIFYMDYTPKNGNIRTRIGGGLKDG